MLDVLSYVVYFKSADESKLFLFTLAMIVCICHRISDTTIAAQAHAGRSFDELQFDLGLATQCGRCEDCARAIVDKCHAEQSTHVECGAGPVEGPKGQPVLLSAASQQSKAWVAQVIAPLSSTNSS